MSRWSEHFRPACMLIAMATCVLPAMAQDSAPAASESASSPASAPLPSKLDLQRSRARTLWRMFLRAPNEEVLSSRRALILFLRDIAPADQLTVAEAMLADDSGEMADAAAVALLNESWGADWLSVEQVRKIVSEGARPPVQRMLVVSTYEGLGEAWAAQSQPAAMPQRGRELFELAIGLVEDLQRQLPASAPASASSPTGTTLPAASAPAGFAGDMPAWTHSRQRLMVNILQPTLACAARWRDPLSDRLWQSLSAVTARGDLGGRGPAMLLASIDGWVGLHQSQTPFDASVDTALSAMGHWDAGVRYKSAAYLARRIEIDQNYNGTLPPDWKSTIDRLRPALNDVRDEVKASAAQVLAFQPLVGGEDLTDKLVSMLLQEPGVPVQQALAEAIIARADRMNRLPAALVDIFDTSRPGPNRTECILSVLARLADLSDAATARRMTILAMNELSTAPRGAMELLVALADSGLLAKTNLRDSVVTLVGRYRDQADRVQRQYIDGQVLPALKR